MKYTKLFILGLLLFLCVTEPSYAQNIPGLTIDGSSPLSSEPDIGASVEDVGFRILDIVRYIFSAVLVLLIVYFGARMILSMGKEEDISSAKNGILYALIGLFFINFPVAIYNAIFNENSSSDNLLINEELFITIIENIINFLEIVVIGIAIIMLVIVGIQLITSRGREEKISEAKSKVLWILVALIFIGFIEAYKRIIIAEGSGGLNMTAVTDIFSAGANLLLYIAGPVMMLFLTIAGFYYITSNGDEERAKKGKSIIINTVIGIILLLCCYVILNDISLLIS